MLMLKAPLSLTVVLMGCLQPKKKARNKYCNFNSIKFTEIMLMKQLRPCLCIDEHNFHLLIHLLNIKHHLLINVKKSNNSGYFHRKKQKLKMLGISALSCKSSNL